MITVGVNVGQALEAVIGQIAPEAGVKQQEKRQPRKRSQERLWLVGVELLPDVPGTITSDACRQRQGRVVIGPEIGAELGYASFLEKLTLRRLIMHRFQMDYKAKRVAPGAFLGLTPGYYTCKCEPERTIQQTDRRARGNKTKCGCGAMMKFMPQDVELNPDDKALKAMYEMYCTAPEASVSPFPRVWGLYDKKYCPTDVREERDKLADEIDRRATAFNLRARSWEVVVKSGVLPTTLVVETLPGVRVGVLSEAEITGEKGIGDAFARKLCKARSARPERRGRPSGNYPSKRARPTCL